MPLRLPIVKDERGAAVVDFSALGFKPRRWALVRIDGDEALVEVKGAEADKLRALTHLRKSTIVERLTKPGELKAVRDTLRQLRDSDDEGELYLVMLWDAGRSFRRAHHAFENLKSMLLAVLVQVHGDEATAAARVEAVLAPEEA